MDVAHVVIRLGETTIDEAYVRAGEHFLFGAGAFPLVTGEGGGFTVRFGARDGVRLEPSEIVRFALGLATVEIRLAVLPTLSVPRPPFDVRPVAYAALSLLAHLGVWLAAIELARGVHPPRIVAITKRHAFLAAPKPTTPPPRVDRSAPVARATQPAPAKAHHIVEPVVTADEAPEFGTTHRFDPDERASFASIPTGSYADALAGKIDDTGREVELCGKHVCRTSGPIALEDVSRALAPEIAHLATCYATRRGWVELEMTIDASGKATDIHATGLGDVADCVTDVIAAVEFPTAASSTFVQLAVRH